MQVVPGIGATGSSIPGTEEHGWLGPFLSPNGLVWVKLELCINSVVPGLQAREETFPRSHEASTGGILAYSHGNCWS